MNDQMVDERLVFFPCGPTNLAGVLTIADRPNGRTVLLPWGTSTAPSSGVNGVRTHLARTLADEGFNSFRFDYPGVGESDGDYHPGEMSAPLIDEIQAACAWLADQGLERIVIVANCFGGWSSLAAASKLSGLEAMALVNPPVKRDHKEIRAGGGGWRWWIKRLRRLRLRKLASAEYRNRSRRMLAAKGSVITGSGSRDNRFSRAVGHLIERRIPLLIIYGADHDFRPDFDSEMENGLRAAIKEAGGSVRVDIVPDRLDARGLASLESQALLVSKVVPWLHSLPALSA